MADDEKKTPDQTNKVVIKRTRKKAESAAETKKERKPRTTVKKKIEPEKPQLLILIVEKQKAEFYADFLHSFQVNVALTTLARGTLTKKTASLLGVEGTEKAVLFAPISEKRSSLIMDKLDEKFKTLRGGKGVALTVPFSGIIGLSAYSFFIDNRDQAAHQQPTGGNE